MGKKNIGRIGRTDKGWYVTINGTEFVHRVNSGYELEDALENGGFLTAAEKDSEHSAFFAKAATRARAREIRAAAIGFLGS